LNHIVNPTFVYHSAPYRFHWLCWFNGFSWSRWKALPYCHDWHHINW
jgi:hypothetical protein